VPQPPASRNHVVTFTSRLPGTVDRYEEWDDITGHLDAVIGALQELHARVDDDAITNHLAAVRLNQVVTALRSVTSAIAARRIADRRAASEPLLNHGSTEPEHRIG
jgi:hypothetical protein